MATVKATFKLDSAAGSLVSSVIAIDDEATLTNLGTSDGVEFTTGIARKRFAAATETQLLAAADYADTKAHKLYIKNTDAGHTTQVEITLGTIGASKSLGFLDPDDWAFIPWQGTEDINVKCTSATTDVEWMLIFE